MNILNLEFNGAFLVVVWIRVVNACTVLQQQSRENRSVAEWNHTEAYQRVTIFCSLERWLSFYVPCIHFHIFDSLSLSCQKSFSLFVPSSFLSPFLPLSFLLPRANMLSPWRESIYSFLGLKPRSSEPPHSSSMLMYGFHYSYFIFSYQLKYPPCHANWLTSSLWYLERGKKESGGQRERCFVGVDRNEQWRAWLISFAIFFTGYFFFPFWSCSFSQQQ